MAQGPHQEGPLERRALPERRERALHDFDISGFSIFGTLGTSNRRYRFKNDTTAVVNIGLRLDHVKKMSLESEPLIVKGNWNKRADTLKRHGAEQDEIDFLRNRSG